MKNGETLQPEIQKSLVCFERFLKTVGFKRIEGSIYGLLVLTSEPVTLEEIHKQLGISKGAASQGLSSLSQWGAVDSKYHPEKRAQVHQASNDSLKIAATIFKKREQMAISEFKENALTSIQTFIAMGDSPQSARIRRLRSITLTCDAADAVIRFIDSLSQIGNIKQYQSVIRTLPKALDAVVFGTKGTKFVASKIKDQIRSIRNP